MKDTTKARIRRFSEERDWEQYHSPATPAPSIGNAAAEHHECFQSSDTDFNDAHVKDEPADEMVYCQNMLDAFGWDEDEIVNAKMTQNERKYPVEKARGNAKKYTEL